MDKNVYGQENTSLRTAPNVFSGPVQSNFSSLVGNSSFNTTNLLNNSTNLNSINTGPSLGYSAVSSLDTNLISDPAISNTLGRVQLPNLVSNVPAQTAGFRNDRRGFFEQAAVIVSDTVTDYLPRLRAYSRTALEVSSGQGFSNYQTVLGRAVNTQLKTAGARITETGRSTGDFLGDHVSQLYFDPANEVNRAVTGTAFW